MFYYDNKEFWIEEQTLKIDGKGGNFFKEVFL